MTLRRNRTAWRLTIPPMAVLASVMSLSVAARGQVLDLDDAPTFPETPISVLDGIAAEVMVGLPASDLSTDTGIVESARATLRRLIAELATRGRGDGDGDAAAALTAMRLAASIESIERRLERLATPGAFTGTPPLRLTETARQRGLDRLEAFSRSALEALRRSTTDTQATFDETITMVLAPIVDAFEVLERRSLADRWPALAAVRAGGVTTVVPALPPLPDRPDLDAVDRALRPGGEDGDRDLHRRFRSVAARAVALDPASSATPLILQTLDATATDDRDTRRRRIEALEIATDIAHDIESIATSRARRDADPDVLATLLGSILAGTPDEAAIVLLGRQRTTVGLVAAGATVDLESIDRDLRAAARAVQQRHRRIVRSTVATLLEIGADPTALGDPDAVGALQALEGSIDDLQRLRTADELASRMTAIRPGAIREFRARIRGWCRMLGDDATRAEGADAIDSVSRDLDRFAPMPAEVWLAEAGPTVLDRTGGRGRDLLDRLTETRRRWADEVFHGEIAGPIRRDLERLARLGDLLMALDAVLADGDDEVAEGLAACDRWAGWIATPERLVWTARQLAPSLRIATAAAADGDSGRLSRDLDRLSSEAPPALLIAWLAAHVGPPLADAATGSVGAIAAAGLPPGPDAWGLRHRAAFARICRAFAEIEAARDRGDAAAADELTDWVVAACDDLLDEVRMANRGGTKDR